MESYEQIPETAREAEPGGVPRDDELVSEADVRAHGEVVGEAERPATVDPDREPEAADPSVSPNAADNPQDPRKVQGSL